MKLITAIVRPEKLDELIPAFKNRRYYTTVAKVQICYVLPLIQRVAALRGRWVDIPQPLDEYALHAG